MSLPSYPSMQAASAATKIPKSVLQQAKKQGCPAFDQANRVHLGKFIEWFFASPESAEEENVNWGERHKRAQALTAEMDLEVAKGELVRIDEVHEQATQCVAKTRAVLTALFVSELPAKSEGMPADRITELNAEALDKALSHLTKLETYK